MPKGANPVCCEREQDMRIALNTPQLNELRYMVSQAIGEFVEASRVPAYEGDMPYLIVSVECHNAHKLIPDDEGQRLPLTGRMLKMDPIPEDCVLRSASQEELDELLNLKDQLDALWNNTAQHTESTAFGWLQLQPPPDDSVMGYTPGEDISPRQGRANAEWNR